MKMGALMDGTVSLQSNIELREGTNRKTVHILA
jgi:hypothetical protein